MRSKAEGRRLNGEWSMVNGEWSMINGEWSMVNGQCSMFNVQCSMLNDQTKKALHKATGNFLTGEWLMLSPFFVPQIKMEVVGCTIPSLFSEEQ